MPGGEVICEAVEINGSACRLAKVHLCEDRPVRIFLNGSLAGAFDTCPQDLEALACGYLICEGLLDSIATVESTVIIGDSVSITAGRAASRLPAREHLSPVEVRRLFERYMSIGRYSPLGCHTGAAHSAILITPYGGVVSSAEDVHGFGAVCKVIGKSALNGCDTGGAILIFTGKATPWTVRAATRAGLPLVISCGPPTRRAIEEARRLGTGLVHISGPGRMDVFYGDELLTGLPEASGSPAACQLSPGTI